MFGKIEWNPSEKELLKFGKVLGVCFTVLGLLAGWKFGSGRVLMFFLILAVSTLGVCRFAPKTAGFYLYRIWMGLLGQPGGWLRSSHP